MLVQHYPDENNDVGSMLEINVVSTSRETLILYQFAIWVLYGHPWFCSLASAFTSEFCYRNIMKGEASARI